MIHYRKEGDQHIEWETSSPPVVSYVLIGGLCALAGIFVWLFWFS
jgi:hypothetical protein